MKKILLTLSALGVASSPAQTATSTTRITAVVPVECSVDIVGGRIHARQITMTVRRKCNTFHTVVVNGAMFDELGDVTLRYNESAFAMRSGFETVNQSARYFDGVDRLVFAVSSGTPEDVERFAASLQIGVDAG